MKQTGLHIAFLSCAVPILLAISANAQIGRRFPSEKKIVTDPVTGIQLTFLTSSKSGDYRIYQACLQWTADRKWIIFRSDIAPGETLAVNVETGDIIQVTEGSYMGVLDVARNSMKLYFMRMTLRQPGQTHAGPVQIVEVDLEKLLADSESGNVREEREYQKVCGTIPAEMEAGGDMALDAGGEWMYFRVGKSAALKHSVRSTSSGSLLYPSGTGDIVSGISRMNLMTGELKLVVAVPFNVTKIVADPAGSGELTFMGSDYMRPDNRKWIVKSDGSELKEVFREDADCPAKNTMLKIIASDDYGGSLYLFDSQSRNKKLLTTGHKIVAQNDLPPVIGGDYSGIAFLSSMLTGDVLMKDICIITLDESRDGAGY